MIDNHFRPHLAKLTRALIRLYKIIGLTPNLLILILMTAHFAVAQATQARNKKTVYFNAWAVLNS